MKYHPCAPSNDLSSEKIKELLSAVELEINVAREELRQKREDFKQILKALPSTGYDSSKLDDFLSYPYAIVPKGEDEWFVVIPRFIDMQVGWLEKQTQSFNIFRVNRYIDWVNPIPEAIKESIGFEKKPNVVLQGDYLFTKPEDQENVFKRYSRFVRMREGNEKIRVRRRAHFNLMAALVKDGILPFQPQPVYNADLIERPSRVKLRDYQEDALEKFLHTGNIGVFWMPSAGKTYLALQIMNQLRGKKLVVVPSLTLMEQWQGRIKDLTSISSSEYQIITYNSAHKVMKDEFVLTVFDECHHLPANVFSKLALIKTKYRLGLSATPYREDGRNELIFALTGFPVGLDWKHLLDLKIAGKPRVRLLMVRDQTSKMAALDNLVRDAVQKKTIIFCDSIIRGKQLAKRYNVRFVYGQTKRRLHKIADAPLIVISRVGDEGISLEKLEEVIEFDFLFGSRRQELQRLGRLFHSTFSGDHVILMTDDEYSNYRKRLFSIYEKGIDISIERY